MRFSRVQCTELRSSNRKRWGEVRLRREIRRHLANRQSCSKSSLCLRFQRHGRFGSHFVDFQGDPRGVACGRVENSPPNTTRVLFIVDATILKTDGSLVICRGNYIYASKLPSMLVPKHPAGKRFLWPLASRLRPIYSSIHQMRRLVGTKRGRFSLRWQNLREQRTLSHQRA